jgi:cell shape-determining protein MreC
MARSTPTYTPPGKYALGCFISIVLLTSDINYQTFSSIRSLTQAAGIYSELTFQYFLDQGVEFTAIRSNKKDLLRANQKLQDELLHLQNKIFLDQQSAIISKELFELEDGTKKLFEDRIAQSFQVASFDLKNYLCCSSHTLHLKNPNKFNIGSNFPVSNGITFIGQTSRSNLNLIKVILLSDSSHVLPIKITDFHCNASGAGKPLTIICLVSRNSQSSDLQINDLAFTSGMGGVYPNNVLIGKIRSIKNINIDEREILIELNGDPLQQNYFGIFL